jgi:anti-anti-sigma regulatory factor
MLKITRRNEDSTPVIQVEGRLVGPWVKELEACWRSVAATESHPVRVDLTAVSYIDDAGAELLKTMCKERVDMKVKGCFTTCLIETIKQAFRGSERTP